MVDSLTPPPMGRVTWDSEGNEGGPFHSRVLHVPSDTSGLTIGRGYDMKRRKPSEILAHMVEAGVPKPDALRISRAAGLQGEGARAFIAENDLKKFEISPSAQKVLFRITYDTEAAEAKRISTKPDVQAKYGPCDWDRLDPAIRDIVVDLKFRGDYTPASRKRIQKCIAANDLAGLAREICDRDVWPGVPKDRFERRKKFMEEALANRVEMPSPAAG